MEQTRDSWAAEARWMVGIVVVGLLAWRGVFHEQTAALLLAPALLMRSAEKQRARTSEDQNGRAAPIATSGVVSLAIAAVPFLGNVLRARMGAGWLGLGLLMLVGCSSSIRTTRSACEIWRMANAVVEHACQTVLETDAMAPIDASQGSTSAPAAQAVAR